MSRPLSPSMLLIQISDVIEDAAVQTVPAINLTSSSTDSLPRPRPAVVPFHSACPLEILRHISRFLDRSTTVSLINASFACLDVCAPVMLEQVVIAEDDLYWNRRNAVITSLFAGRVSDPTHLRSPLAEYLLTSTR